MPTRPISEEARSAKFSLTKELLSNNVQWFRRGKSVSSIGSCILPTTEIVFYSVALGSLPLGGTFDGIPNLKGRERSFLEVKVFDNDVDKALKVLKNKLSKNGLFKELKLRRAYEKPSVKRKRKALEARRRLAKIQRRRHS
jgi:small subunit ribosomal protein S21